MAGAACRRYGHHLPHRRLQRGRVAAVWGGLHHDHCRKDSGHRHLAKQPAHLRDVRDGIHLRPRGYPAPGGGQQFWDLCHLHLLRGALLCSAGLSDLYTDDGTKGWITKLDSAERVTEWLASFDAKGTSETVTDYQTMDLTVAGYSARAIVYQDETGWNSEVLVNFGKDLGNDTYPMYAAYLYFTGPTYLSVWSEDVQAIVNSLTLPQ